MGNMRRRVKHTLTFEERLAEEVKTFKEAAERESPDSMARQLLLRRARLAEIEFQMKDRRRSAGLQLTK